MQILSTQVCCWGWGQAWVVLHWGVVNGMHTPWWHVCWAREQGGLLVEHADPILSTQMLLIQVWWTLQIIPLPHVAYMFGLHLLV